MQFCVDDSPGVKYPAGNVRNTVLGSVGSKELSSSEPPLLPPPQALSVIKQKEQSKALTYFIRVAVSIDTATLMGRVENRVISVRQLIVASPYLRNM